MATTLSYDLTYDAPLDEVHAMLMDPAFREQVCDAQRATRRSATVEPEGGGQVVVVDQVQATEGMPGFARKIVGDTINLIQTEHWSGTGGGTLTGTLTGTVDVVIPGKPGTMSGTIALRESGGTTTETVTMDIKVSVPLVGGRLEGLVSDMLRRALQVENTVGRQYLGG